jgi:hypothetical protein
MGGFDLHRGGATAATARRRTFTVEQANRALPLIQRITSDIVAQYQQLEHLQRKRKKLLRLDRREEVAELDARAAEGAKRLNELIDELGAIGCELKDWEHGLVDLPAVHDGREVYLCWKLGEPTISHWHELQAGAIGRQSIDGGFGRAEARS